MPDPADTSSSVEEPPVKPTGDGGAPAPSDGSTSAGGAHDPMDPEPTPGEPGASRPAGSRLPAGPPSDPGNDQTG